MAIDAAANSPLRETLSEEHGEFGTSLTGPIEVPVD